MLAETRSIAALAVTAERLGMTFALESLAPVFPGPEMVSADPLAIRALTPHIDSSAVGLCLDDGHAERDRRPAPRLARPDRRAELLDMVTSSSTSTTTLGPSDLPQPQAGSGSTATRPAPRASARATSPETGVRFPSLLAHDAPMLLEIHAPRAAPGELYEACAIGAITQRGRTASPATQVAT